MPGNKKNKKNQIFSSMEIDFKPSEKVIPYGDNQNGMNTEMVEEAKEIDSTIGINMAAEQVPSKKEDDEFPSKFISTQHKGPISISNSVTISQDTKKKLSPENIIPNSLYHSYGLYTKEEIREYKFNKFSRFGRLLDLHGRINPCREYLFFVKPDLHICKNMKEEALYDSELGKNKNFQFPSDGGKIRVIDGLYLNPQLGNSPYFRSLYQTNNDVLKELQYSIDSRPFSCLLSSSVNSPLSMDESSAKTMDNMSTLFGTTYNYLQDSIASDESYSFSLEFVDDKYLNTYHFFKAYSMYHNLRRTGHVTPPSSSYYQKRRLHNTMGIYKFIVTEDTQTLLYWAYFWGVIPTNCPRDVFGDPSFSGENGLSFTIQFEAAFVDDLNPYILENFNNLMVKQAASLVQREYLPLTWIEKESFSGNSIPVTEYHVDGTLPSFALVFPTINGAKSSNPHRGYKLLWYTGKKQ